MLSIDSLLSIDIDMIMIDAQKQITAIHSMKKAVFSEGESEKEHLEKPEVRLAQKVLAREVIVFLHQFQL